MTFGEFIKTIKKIGKIRGDQNEMVSDIFVAAGAFEVSYYTAESWIKGKSTPDASTHFPKEINVAGFINYFSDRLQSTWKELHKALCDMDEHEIFNPTPEDKYEFYQNLLHQFCELLRLPRPKGAISLYRTRLENHKIIGRENELQKIEKIYKASNYAVLTGIGGIGKSHTALAYAYNLQEIGDWTIQRVICEDSEFLRDAIARLEFVGLIDDYDELDSKLNLRLSMLQSYRKPALIILDNLTRKFTPVDQMFFEKLTDCKHVRLLITSRKALFINKQNVIEIESMDEDLLLELYSYHRFKKPDGHEAKAYIDEHKEILKEIFEKVEKHTLTIELLAKLPMRSGMDEYAINEYLKDGLNVSTAIVGTIKDNKDIEGTVKEIIKKIFSVSQLNETEINIMRHMALVSPEGIYLELFSKFTGFSPDDIIKLVNSNWVIMTETTPFRIRLHPLISEIMFDIDETKPSKEMCNVFIKNLSSGKLIDFVLKNLKIYNHGLYDLNMTSYRVALKIIKPDFAILNNISFPKETYDIFHKNSKKIEHRLYIDPYTHLAFELQEAIEDMDESEADLIYDAFCSQEPYASRLKEYESLENEDDDEDEDETE